jgi:hypothetical protein
MPKVKKRFRGIIIIFDWLLRITNQRVSTLTAGGNAAGNEL